MTCDICGKEMASFTHIINNEEPLVVCVGCRDREEVRADYEYERQREEGLNV